MRFLHCTITATSGGVEVGCFNPNELFARGLSPLPRISRCPVFVSEGATPLSALRAFLLPHVFATAQIWSGRLLAPALGPIALLLLEAARSGWGSRALARVLFTLPRRCGHPLFAAIRALAAPMRRHGAIPVLTRALRLHERDGTTRDDATDGTNTSDHARDETNS